VAVASRVVGGGGGDAVSGQVLGDCEQSRTSEVLGKDASDDECGDWVRFQTVKASAHRRLPGVGMTTSVGQPVAVRRSTAEESTFVLRLGCHGRPHVDFDAISFTLRHPAIEVHHEVMGVAVGVHLTAHFRDPQFDAIGGENGKS